MSYLDITAAIRNCAINDENEFDLFVDEISGQLADVELSIVQREELIKLFLNKIEDQPNPDFTSWSLIHFLEWLDEDNSTDYNDQILHSVRNNPKAMTLLLLNRILSSLPAASVYRMLGLDAMKEISENSSVQRTLRKEANELSEYQLEKNKK